MGPASHLGVQVLTETMMSSPGKALVRVVQESVQQHRVTVSDGRRALGGPLLLGSYTSFLAVSPGWQSFRAAGYSEATTQRVFLSANSIHTLVVLDNHSGLRIHSLRDAVGSKTMPTGGAATGFGGTAPGPAPSPAPLAAAIVAGVACCAAAAYWLHRGRRQARHAR
jgi:hypothetical protein